MGDHLNRLIPSDPAFELITGRFFPRSPSNIRSVRVLWMNALTTGG